MRVAVVTSVHTKITISCKELPAKPGSMVFLDQVMIEVTSADSSIFLAILLKNVMIVSFWIDD
jgi:hypothetical protein